MITKETVQYIASLSRLHISEDKVEGLRKNLEDILGYVDKLGKLDVTGVKPTTHTLPIQNVFRADEVRPSLKQEDVMKLAVEHHNGFFKVPRVIE